MVVDCPSDAEIRMAIRITGIESNASTNRPRTSSIQPRR